MVLFENEISDCWTPKSRNPCCTSLGEAAFSPLVCVRCSIVPAQNTAAAPCFPLPCQKSHKELKDTQGLTLMVQLLTIGCCVKSEWLLHGLAPWGGLGAGWALEPGCWGADRCWHQSQGAAWCFLIRALETQSSSMWLLEKGGFIFHGKSSVWRSSIRHWAVEKTKFFVQLLEQCTLNELLGAGAWGTKGYMGISQKVFHHTVGIYFRFFLILNYSLLLQPEQWSSQCYQVWVGL